MGVVADGITKARRYHPLIMKWVHANIVQFEIEWRCTEVHVFEFILVQVRPPPQTRIDHMWKPFTASHLQHQPTSRPSHTCERMSTVYSLEDDRPRCVVLWCTWFAERRSFSPQSSARPTRPVCPWAFWQDFRWRAWQTFRYRRSVGGTSDCAQRSPTPHSNDNNWHYYWL